MKRKLVDPIDRLPNVKYDKEKLVNWLFDQRYNMSLDRQAWLVRSEKYLSQWDDYVTYTRDGPWDNSSNLHLPLSMEKMKALHARFKAALTSVRPWWMILPLEKLDIQRISTIDQVMNWACQAYVNHYKGVMSTLDDWIWDFCGVGWAVLERRWEVVERNAIVVETITEQDKIENAEVMRLLGEEMQQKDPDEEKVAREVKKLITFFDGPILETVSHEDILFPGKFQDVSDLDQPPVIFRDFQMVLSDFNANIESEFFDRAAAERCKKSTAPTSGEGNLIGPEDATKVDYKRAQDVNQGIQVVDSNVVQTIFYLTKAYCRYDIDGDGICEELIVTLDTNTRELLRLTYLDRHTLTGKRPVHKIDFIRRPRRAYSIGLLELLHPINREMDAIHNMRIDFGTLANIPFFFYRPSAGFKGEVFRIEPGKGFPVDEPNSSVSFPKFNTSQTFGANEEASLDRWADRVTSINAMNMGVAQPASGAARTASGLQALLNEANMNLDVILDRLKSGWGQVLTGLLADLQERMPDKTIVRILGADGLPIMGQDKIPVFKSVNRTDIAGRVDFLILANSANVNRELEKQTAMQQLQLMMNPLFIQTGLVTPQNLYIALKRVLDKSGDMLSSELVTPPQNVEVPQTFQEEMASITQGLMPKIVLNDNHAAKAASIEMFIQEPAFMEGMRLGTVSKNALEMAQMAIQAHRQMQSAIDAQAQQQNTTGLQISPSLGARMTGQTGETGNALPEENVPRGAPPQSEVGKGNIPQEAAVPSGGQ